MPTFKVPYTYTMWGVHMVEAETPEAAIEAVEDGEFGRYSIQSDDEYIDDSFAVCKGDVETVSLPMLPQT